jgi:hypothetical protein
LEQQLLSSNAGHDLWETVPWLEIYMKLHVFIPAVVGERVKRACQCVLGITPRAPTSYSSMRTETRAVSTLNPGIIRASFEHWSDVISLHMVINSPITALRLPVRAAERRREMV